MPDRFFVLDYETTGVTYHDVPIEVGVVVTDAEWNELARYERLIRPAGLAGVSEERYADAERFHRIPRARLWAYGAAPIDVAGDLVALATSHRPDGGRLILLSDNIQFEWRHTDWLLSHLGLTVPEVFHYCGWDTSLLSLFTAFRDPEETEHRALSDALGLVAELRRVAGLRRVASLLPTPSPSLR